MIDFYLKALKSDSGHEVKHALSNIEDLCSEHRSNQEYECYRKRSSSEFRRMLNGPERKEILEALSIAYSKLESMHIGSSAFMYSLDLIEKIPPMEGLVP